MPNLIDIICLYYSAKILGRAKYLQIIFVVVISCLVKDVKLVSFGNSMLLWSSPNFLLRPSDAICRDGEAILIVQNMSSKSCGRRNGCEHLD